MIRSDASNDADSQDAHRSNANSGISASSTAFVHEITPLALAKLANQKRVYDRLDWWPLEVWRTSDALIAIADPAPARQHTPSLAAALLVVPMSVSEESATAASATAASATNGDQAGAVQLYRSAAPVAWLRWCAVAEGQSPSARLAQLLREAVQRCRRVGISELWCLSEPQGWLGLNLRDLGFKRSEELITLSLSTASMRRMELPVQPVQPASGALLRVLRANQLDGPTLDALQRLDRAAFAPPWHYSKHVLRQALAEARYVTVAEINGCIVGYQCSIMNVDVRGAASQYSYGHVTRLAVHPQVQHRGIGRWLFADALHALSRLGAAEVTLNTLSSNSIAQKFYRQFGFVPLPERMAVLSRLL